MKSFYLENLQGQYIIQSSINQSNFVSYIYLFFYSRVMKQFYT